MGNEASSVHIHSALTAEDLKALRSHFPGGGNSLEVKFNLLQYVHFKCIFIWNPRYCIWKMVYPGQELLWFNKYKHQ